MFSKFEDGFWIGEWKQKTLIMSLVLSANIRESNFPKKTKEMTDWALVGIHGDFENIAKGMDHTNFKYAAYYAKELSDKIQTINGFVKENK